MSAVSEIAKVANICQNTPCYLHESLYPASEQLVEEASEYYSNGFNAVFVRTKWGSYLITDLNRIRNAEGRPIVELDPSDKSA